MGHGSATSVFWEFSAEAASNYMHSNAVEDITFDNPVDGAIVCRGHNGLRLQGLRFRGVTTYTADVIRLDGAAAGEDGRTTTIINCLRDGGNLNGNHDVYTTQDLDGVIIGSGSVGSDGSFRTRIGDSWAVVQCRFDSFENKYGASYFDIDEVWAGNRTAGGGQGGVVVNSAVTTVTNVGSPGAAITLPDAFIAATQFLIKNEGNNFMNVFPASGDDLGNGTDIPYALPQGHFVTFMATSSNDRWTPISAGSAISVLARLIPSKTTLSLTGYAPTVSVA